MEPEGSLPYSQVPTTCPYQSKQDPEKEQRYSSTLSLTLSLNWGVGGGKPCPCRSTPGEFSMGMENLAPTGVPSPDHPACSEVLYRLCYPGPQAIG
jgi:hypothetical protein